MKEFERAFAVWQAEPFQSGPKEFAKIWNLAIKAVLENVQTDESPYGKKQFVMKRTIERLMATK